MSKYNFDQILERRDTDSIKWNNYPADVIPMWIADSDFATPEQITRALSRRVEHLAFGYADMNKMLDEAARHWAQTRLGWNASKACSAFAPGVVSSVALAIQAFTHPNENVVTLSPSYPPLIHKARQNGRKSVASQMLRNENGHYSIDFEDLEAKLSLRASSLFLLCNPHNPTGRVFSRAELLRISALCLANDVLVFSDEIHCDYVHKGKHISFPSLSPECAQNSLVSINPSKTFNIAGLHTAVLMTENAGHLKHFHNTVMSLGLHANILGATAFHTAYMQCADYADEVRKYIKGNIDYAVEFIRHEIPAIQVASPEATYLLWLDCHKLGLHQDELMRLFIERAKVAPGSGTDYNSLHGYEGEGFLRLNLACPRSRLEEALGRMARTL